MKIFIRIIITFACAVLSFVAPLFFLGFTETGFALLIKGASSFSGDFFSVEKTEGSLRSNINLTGVEIKSSSADISIKEFTFFWKPGALLRKDLHIELVSAENLQVAMHQSTETTEETDSSKLPDILLPLDVVLEEMTVNNMKVYQPGSDDPFHMISARLGLTASGDQVQLHSLAFDTPEYGGKLQGAVQLSRSWPLSFTGSYRFSGMGEGVSSGELTVEGDIDEISFTTALYKPSEVSIHGKIQDLQKDLQWDVQIKTEGMHLQQINTEWPQLELSVLIDADGGLDTYQAKAQSDILMPDHQRLQIDAIVKGDLEGLEISSAKVLLPEGTVNAAGNLRWQEKTTWQVAFEASEVNPGAFISEWPGAIDLRVTSRGELAEEKVGAVFHIDKLAGALRDYPVTGSGTINLQERDILIDSFQLHSGETSLQISGSIKEIVDIQFKGSSSNLASILPESGGALDIQGMLKGSRETPKFISSLSGTGLQYKDLEMGSLKGVVELDLSEKGDFNVDLISQDILVSDQSVRLCQIKLDGSMDDHRMEVVVNSDFADGEIAVTGSMQGKQWQGKMSEFFLVSGQYGTWKQDTEVLLELGPEKGEVKGLCIGEGNMTLCVNADWENKGNWNLDAKGDSLRLQKLHDWGLITQELEGTGTLAVKASGEKTFVQSADISLDIPDIALIQKDEDDAEMTYRWNGNLLKATLENEEMILTAATSFQDGSMVDLSAKITECKDVRNIVNLPLTGQLNLQVNDLYPLAPLSGYVIQPSGSLEGSYTLDGTIAQPELTGKLKLENGSLGIPSVGLQLEDVTVSLASAGKSVVLNLDARSGEGELTLEGTVSQNAEKQWLLDAIIKGERFTAINTPEYTAIVNPDLSLWSNGIVTKLSGTISVPVAIIAPVGSGSMVSPSKDVIVVDEEQETAGKDLPLEMDIKLLLGKDVQIDTYGLKGLLAGELTIKDKPGQAVTGIGNLKFHEGTFTFKGRVLEISRGRIYYQGGVISNPGINVRAERKIQDIVAGILVNGTINDMKMSLFSNPHMDDSDILAYILVGHDMSLSNKKEGSMLASAAATIGIASAGPLVDSLKKTTGVDDVYLESGSDPSDVSLVFGKEVSKGLYISYGQDLVKSIGTFKARYDLGYGFSVQTMTSSEESGADLLWSFER